MLLFGREIVSFLGLPSIPRKEWDGKTSFKTGVAVVNLSFGNQAYAVATFDSEKEKEPRIIKVFSPEIFISVDKIFVVPDYMDVDGIDGSDLDEASKKAARELAKEAKDAENEGTEMTVPVMPDNEYCYPHIHNDEEARAYIKAWNKRNGIKRGNIPSTHENIVSKLTAMWMSDNNDNRKK